MLHILNLFARSPFAPLQSHMDKVAATIALLTSLFTDPQKILKEISELEHQADQIKSEIRNNLPSNLFLAIDRNTFLTILELQDAIADKAEDIAVLLSYKKLLLEEPLKTPYERFLAKNIECFEQTHKIIQELHELVESSFGGSEAEHVKAMCSHVALKEHEADRLQSQLLQVLYSQEDKLSYASFILWDKVFEATGAIANLSEQLADQIRTTLDVK